MKKNTHCSRNPQRCFCQRYFCYIFLLLFCCLLLPPATVLAQDSAAKIRCVVTKIIDNTNNDGWKDQLIAYGIRNIVNNELYDTGKYIPVEDDPEMMQQIDKLIASNWQAAVNTDGAVDVEQQVKQIADCLVTVTVRDFKVKRRRSIGLFSAAKTTIKITVDVELKHNDGTLLKVTGSGKGVTKSMGILFQIREDKVHFNETTVGQATQEAIHNAIKKL